ncbi:MAG: hypothetical protein ABIQ10_00785 [Gemmatimonadaceae bacterium]
MILQLMRRDLSWRISTPAVSVGILAVVSFVRVPSLAIIAGIPYCFFVWSWMPRRGGAFDAALPIRGRELFAARYLSALALMMLPFIVATVAGVVSSERDFSVGVVFEYMAIVALATLLPYGLRPGQVSEPPLWLIALVWAALAGVSAIVLHLLDPFTGLALFLGATIIVGRALWMDLPDSLQVARKHVVKNRPMPETLDRLNDATSFLVPKRWLSIMRSQFSATAFLYYAFILFSAVAGTWLLALLITLSGLGSRLRYRMRWLEAYPLSHRARLLFLLLPTVGASMLCLEAGHIISDVVPILKYKMGSYAPEPSVDRDYWQNRTKVRLEYWQLLHGNPVPSIVAPWGEGAVADTISILGMTLFDPYTTAVSNSERFVEWQFARATRAVYGYSISLSQSRAGIQAEPMITGSRVMQLLNGGAAVTLALFITWIFEVLRWNVLGRRRVLRYSVNAILGGTYLWGLAYWFHYITRARRIILPLAEKVLWWESTLLPDNIAVVAITAVIPAIVMYALLEWQFARSELTVRVPKAQS